MEQQTRQPQLRRNCPTCDERHAKSSYKGRIRVVRAWDGNSTREYHLFECGRCGSEIRQEVGR